jgi:hypothetical protein
MLELMASVDMYLIPIDRIKHTFEDGWTCFAIDLLALFNIADDDKSAVVSCALIKRSCMYLIGVPTWKSGDPEAEEKA